MGVDCGSSERKDLTMARYSFLLALHARSPLRWRRRVHPGLLRVLRQPHLQTLWVWSVGCGIQRVWVQLNGLQSKLFLRGLPLCRLKLLHFEFCFIANSKLIFK